eukprot:2753800-Alexandrium_andersonii.AAC.1
MHRTPNFGLGAPGWRKHSGEKARESASSCFKPLEAARPLEAAWGCPGGGNTRGRKHEHLFQAASSCFKPLEAA